MEPIIRVEGLVKRYRGAEKNAVDGVSLDVAPGEFFALLGPNGAGKTTTISILTTTLSPTAGSVVIGGRDVQDDPAAVRRTLGIIFQKPSLDLNLTAEENVRFHAILYGLYPFRPTYRTMPRAYREQVEDLAGVLGMEGEMFGAVKTFSGGMKRKLEIIRSLVHRPKVLFLDEPTTGLDPQSRSALWSEVGRLARDEGVTVFLTTQYLEEADVLADRVGIINKGKIAAEGTPEELKAEIGRPSVEATPASRGERDKVAKVLTRFGEEISAQPGAVAVRLMHGAGDLADVVRALDGEGLKVTNLRIEEPTLDDVFLEKTGRSLEGAGDGGMEESQ